jgi:hypothetical protein
VKQRSGEEKIALPQREKEEPVVLWLLLSVLRDGLVGPVSDMREVYIE